jgi:hypothetical protein
MAESDNFSIECKTALKPIKKFSEQAIHPDKKEVYSMEQNKVKSNIDVTYIVAQFKEKCVPNDKIINWMQSKDIEVLGAIYDFISRKKYYKKIYPGLTAEDYNGFIMHFFKRCILEIPSTDWKSDHFVLSRYDAGYDFVRWFKIFWNDPNVPKSIVYALKEWLENIYKDGDEEIRECIITAMLEHLFNNEEIATFFSDWLSDPILKPAYERAMECAGIVFG